MPRRVAATATAPARGAASSLRLVIPPSLTCPGAPFSLILVVSDQVEEHVLERAAGRARAATPMPAAASTRVASAGSGTASCMPPAPAISADRPGRDQPALVHDDDVRAGLLDLGQQVAGHDDRAPGRGVVAAAPRASRRSAAGRGRWSARRAPAPRAGRAWPARCRAAAACRGCRRGPAGRSTPPSPAMSSAVVELGLVVGSRPVAAQYSRRFSRPVRCGRKPGPSMNAPSRASTGAPGTTGSPNTCTCAGGRRDQPDQHAQRGGLAGAVRAEQPDDLAALDPEADVVDRAVAAGVLLDQRLDADRHVGEVGSRLEHAAGGARSRTPTEPPTSRRRSPPTISQANGCPALIVRARSSSAG